jgi:hypothetical protein
MQVCLQANDYRKCAEECRKVAKLGLQAEGLGAFSGDLLNARQAAREQS